MHRIAIIIAAIAVIGLSVAAVVHASNGNALLAAVVADSGLTWIVVMWLILIHQRLR